MAAVAEVDDEVGLQRRARNEQENERATYSNKASYNNLAIFKQIIDSVTERVCSHFHNRH